MATRRGIGMLLFAVMIVMTTAALTGCNSGSTFDVQNPGGPHQGKLSIAFAPTPPTSVNVGFTVNYTAVVSNDPDNYGVQWNLVCPTGIAAGSCGTLSATSTTCQGTTCGSITYTPPSPITGSSETVTIVASAFANPAVNTLSTLTIGSFDSGLQSGSYVFQAQGTEAGSFGSFQSVIPYQIAGVVQIDGAGNVTAYEQTVNYFGSSLADSVVSATGSPAGSYFVGDDGRGLLTLNDPSVGPEIFALVFLNNGSNPQALLSQTGIDATAATATGTLELQSSTTAPTGSYAFVSSGAASIGQSTLPIAFGGIMTIASGNVTGVGDELFGKNLTQNGASLCLTAPCALSAPDSYGQVTFNLTPGFGPSNAQKTVTINGYIVDSTHIRLIESDYNTDNLHPFGLTDGLAIAQTSGSANNFGATIPPGPYVFGVTGTDLSTANSAFVVSSLTAAAQFTVNNGNGTPITGFTDTFLDFDTAQGNPSGGAQISATFGGTYTVDSTGRAVVDLGNFVAPSPLPPITKAYTPEYIFYLTDSQNPAPALVLNGEVTASPNYYPSLGTGILYPQSAAVATFTGDLGISFTQVGPNPESDGTGQMNVNSSNTPAVTGLADSTLATPQDTDPADHAFTGTVAATQGYGIFAGTLLDSSGVVSPFELGINQNPENPISVDYYSIDSAHGFFVETDLVNLPPASPPTPSGQVSLGYYLGRTSLCASCP